MTKFDDWYKDNQPGYSVGSSDCFLKERLERAFEAGQKAGPEWIPVSDRLPVDCRNVFIKGVNDCGMDRTAKAMYCREFELIASPDYNEEWCDYKEETDEYFVPEGWYEDNTSSETDYAIDFKVTHWQPLPEIK